jgi:hypothetical protein
MKGYFYRKTKWPKFTKFQSIVIFELLDFYIRILEVARIYKVYFFKKHSYLVYSHMWLNLFEQCHKIEKK